MNYEQTVYEIVAMIPRGKVATYGQIAFLSGYPKRARMVGLALANAPARSKLPCHRVVNSVGRTAPGWNDQPLLLAQEGVRLKANNLVDLDHCQWEGILLGDTTILD